MTPELIVLLIAIISFTASVVTVSLKLTREIENLQDLIGIESIRIMELINERADELKSEINKDEEEYIYYESEDKNN